ncbi:hypothetical protein GON26_03850 [Flavobacterium sp. GA093]|uniref:Uncharacterized protein n=1 Tax=Flavobacterium hydrocarbonoxydans TaxID=2683249 RepID=A0A6I4NFZ5_9FLAO|nr:hypothetical protein [Flavobacterium hydrocarbonoxydans]MWB93480.1 hypothetical protein [Flavobacterium hydrocarbonoxydans]
MKKILLIVMLFLSIKNYAQVAITPSDRGANEEFEKGELEKFKSTTTIFVLPQLNKTEDYEKILKEVWTVTPYKVVEFKDFKMSDYANGTYSIAKFIGDISISGKGTVYIHTNFTIRILDKEKFDKGFAKLKPDDKKYNKKLSGLFNENLTYIARAPLSVNNKFLVDAMVARSDEKISNLYDRMYTEQSFTNTNLGILKNYFQQINQIISKGEHCGLYDDYVTPEIKSLKENTLYIPEAYMMEYNAWKGTEKLRDEKDLKKLVEDYKYKYQFIRDEDLEKKILNNEDIFYLRYVSMNGNKYLDVVNAKTGNPAYYFYGAGFAYNLKDDDFKNISKAISK